MLRRSLIALAITATAGLAIYGCQSSATKTSEPLNTARKKLLFFTRSQGFEHSVVKVVDGKPCYAETVLRPICEAHNWDLDVTKDGTVFEPGSIEKYDAFLFYTTGDLTAEQSKDNSKPMSAAGKAALIKAVENGKGWMGFHCASDTFHAGERYQTQAPADRDPYIQMIGGEFIVHGAQQITNMHVVDSKFPGFDKLGAGFDKHEEWYALKNFADNLHVLLVTETLGMKGGMYQRPKYPGTWARMHGQGRVFYTSMGHREDVWTSPEFQTVAISGIKWITHEVNADVTPNITKVTPNAEVVPAQEPKQPKPAPKNAKQPAPAPKK
jgi:hypothetical protein